MGICCLCLYISTQTKEEQRKQCLNWYSYMHNQLTKSCDKMKNGGKKKQLLIQGRQHESSIFHGNINQLMHFRPEVH